MKLEDIARSAIKIAGGDWDSLPQEHKDKGLEDVQFVIDNPKTTPAQWHKMMGTDIPYKNIKASGRAKYKTVLATINALKDISGGSDEKGDFLECDSIEDVKPARYVGVDWGINGFNLHTKSTPKGQTEPM